MCFFFQIHNKIYSKSNIISNSLKSDLLLTMVMGAWLFDALATGIVAFIGLFF
jgi:hypothetical protein